MRNELKTKKPRSWEPRGHDRFPDLNLVPNLRTPLKETHTQHQYCVYKYDRNHGHCKWPKDRRHQEECPVPVPHSLSSCCSPLISNRSHEQYPYNKRCHEAMPISLNNPRPKGEPESRDLNSRV